MEETSLDDFLDDGEESSPDADPEPETGTETESEEPTTEPAKQGPATSRWTPDGEACEACGETVTRLWDDDGRRVCRSCKQW